MYMISPLCRFFYVALLAMTPILASSLLATVAIDGAPAFDVATDGAFVDVATDRGGPDSHSFVQV